jgi:hypothetical protein
MNTLFVCTLIFRAMIDNHPVGYYHCTDGQLQCYEIRTDRNCWNPHFNSHCEGQVISRLED